MKIRPITEQDRRSLLEMSAELWPELSSRELEEGINEVLHLDYEQGFVAVNDTGESVGFAYASVRRDYVEGATSRGTGYLEAVFAKPEYRRMNVAKLLTEAVENWCLSQGCTEIGSDTDISNTTSQSFHKGVGYRIAGTNVHFIKDLDTKKG